MKTLRRLMLMALGLAVVAAIVYAYLPQPVEVSVTSISRGPMDVSIEEEGRARVQERYVITAPVSAYAPRLEFRVGDPVRAGQTLAVLDPLPPGVLDARSRAQAQARVAQAKAALQAAQTDAEAAKAGADYARRESLRAQALRKSGAISQTLVDQAESEERRTAALLASATAGIDVARYDLAAAETALRYTDPQARGTGERITVKSPVDGAILAIEHEDEGALTAAQPILTVGDPHFLEVAVDLLSSDAVRVHSGTRVEFSHWGGADVLRGRVRNVEPVAFTKISALGVEEQRVLVIVDLTSPKAEWATLGDGYRLEARFTLWQADDVLRVPSSALYRRGDSWAVLAVVDGRLVERTLKIGERGEDFTQVISGLSAGESVVTFPDDSLRPGSRAKVIESTGM